MVQEFQDVKSKLTVWQHGVDVWVKFYDLINHMQSNNIGYKHALPKWVGDYKDILLSCCVNKMDDIKDYLVYHDCGKPFCLYVDSEGKRHFPNHAQISKEVFLQYSNNKLVGNLIGNDMLCHITKPKDFLSICDVENIEVLLCAGIASIHANADMFGGFDSDSFKMKFKNLDKLGERILKHKYNFLKEC